MMIDIVCPDCGDVVPECNAIELPVSGGVGCGACAREQYNALAPFN